MLELTDYIRDIPDWPKPGILFKDISPLLSHPAALALSVELMANPFRGRDIDLVIGTESRGFIFGTAIAQSLSAGFVPVRKPNKLPHETRRIEYELEYGTDVLEIHKDAVSPDQTVLVVDDVLATGGTMAATCELVRMIGANIAAISVLIELDHLQGRSKLDDSIETHAVLHL